MSVDGRDGVAPTVHQQRAVWVRAVFAALYDGIERIEPGFFFTEAGQRTQRYLALAEGEVFRAASADRK